VLDGVKAEVAYAYDRKMKESLHVLEQDRVFSNRENVKIKEAMED